MQGKICRLATHTGLVVVLAVSLTSAAAPAVRLPPAPKPPRRGGRRAGRASGGRVQEVRLSGGRRVAAGRARGRLGRSRCRPTRIQCPLLREGRGGLGPEGGGEPEDPAGGTRLERASK